MNTAPFEQYRGVTLDPDLTVPSSFIEPRRSITITAVAPVVQMASRRRHPAWEEVARRDWFIDRPA